MMIKKYKKLTGIIIAILVITVTVISVAEAVNNKEDYAKKEEMVENTPVPDKEPEKEEEPIETDSESVDDISEQTENSELESPIDIDEDTGMPAGLWKIRKQDWIETLAEEYGKSINQIEDLYSEIGDLNDVKRELEKLKLQDKMLSDDRVIELVKKGIGVLQVEKAEEIAAKTDMDTEEILEMRYGDLVKPEEEKLFSALSVEEPKKRETKEWEDIEKELGIEEKTPLEQLEVPESIVKEMEEMGLSSQEMVDIALLSTNNNVPHEEVWDKIKSGKTHDELYQQYLEEGRRASSGDITMEERIQQLERDVVDVLGATEEEVALCRENGIEGFSMYTAKTLSIDYNVSLEILVEKFNRLGDWDKVIDEMGERD
ncbi:hypothetical protein RBH29_05200 [Herbivorax sp. ANBcel31]|uniref:hypothetical protein n=1 Tax=Herbivorax sp. ANBcel31 TaxID=3069754 RepID=UPI0027B828CC|nr:hypothetical protein [Herbivorax sp. ANBcel31]MDQ2085832.1 hypothetical protein [Herbivorax sp. ANBcel31]